MPPKKKIKIAKKSKASIKVEENVTSNNNNDLNVGSTSGFKPYNILSTRSGRSYEMDNIVRMIGPKKKPRMTCNVFCCRLRASMNNDIKNVITRTEEINSKIATNEARIAKSLRAIKQEKDVVNNKSNKSKNNNKDKGNELDIKNIIIKKEEIDSTNIITNQGRNTRSTRSTKQNNEGTSSSKNAVTDNGNNNEEEGEEEEEEKGPKKRKHFSIFEKNSNKKTKKFKKGQPLKIWSWNVAGLRANVKKNGHSHIKESNADLISLQETKCPELPPEIVALDDYCFKKLANSTKNGGHAGVAMLAKEMPIKVVTGIGDKEFDTFGRYIEAEFENFFFISIYVPNSGAGLVNLPARGRWDQLLLTRITNLDKLKPVIIAGDMNVAHQEIDLRNPDTNRNKTAGFTDQEREAFTRLLEAGFVDVWRSRNPDVAEVYTYWSYIGTRRAKNIGWRLDYFVISERILDKVIECEIHREITGSQYGSDHCPISLIIDI